MPPPLRLFIAVELDEAIRQSAARLAEQLAGRFGPGARRSVSWVVASNMHLTLKFIGEVDERVAQDLAALVSRGFSTPSFPIEVGGLGAFPPAGPPRVLWLGIRRGADRLAGLHGEVERRVGDLGMASDGRPFHGHLTLGRVKAPIGPAARVVLASIPGQEAGGGTVSGVTLFESRLSPRGPVYASLARGALGGG